jgi:hypothetical protein
VLTDDFAPVETLLAPVAGAIRTLMRRVLPASASVALAGAATMALEILLPRRLAPEVGTTSAVWTAGIAVVLTGLALGSALGGRSADADDAPGREARRLALAALLAAVAPFLARAAAGAAPGGVATRAFAGMLAGGFLPCASPSGRSIPSRPRGPCVTRGTVAAPSASWPRPAPSAAWWAPGARRTASCRGSRCRRPRTRSRASSP